jgi:hypothetical protein
MLTIKYPEEIKQYQVKKSDYNNYAAKDKLPSLLLNKAILKQRVKELKAIPLPCEKLQELIKELDKKSIL